MIQTRHNQGISQSMETISLPTKIDYKPGERPNQSIVTIEPLYPGYGHTLGVALRRVLLSSLEGGAIVAVKIKGAQHEFSTLPYVKDDVVDIILNLKRLRFKVFSDETVRLSLKVRGEKDVKGSDIENTSEAEIANPDAFICSLTNKNAQLEMELFVKKGRGYFPTESREKEKLEIGTIAVDALFTPVRNVGLRVEDVRVGQMTNYNKVIMDIETDGSITSEQALEQATKILGDQFSAVSQLISGPVTDEKQDTFVEEDDVESDEASVVPSDEEDLKEPKKRGRPKKGS